MRVPFEKGMENSFSIAVAAKVMAELLELRPQLKMVVNLSIEDDDAVLVRGVDGLVAPCKIENLEPCCAHGAQRGLKDALLVWTAMSQCRGDGADAIRVAGPAFLSESSYTAQKRYPRDNSSPGRRSSAEVEFG